MLDFYGPFSTLSNVNLGIPSPVIRDGARSRGFFFGIVVSKEGGRISCAVMAESASLANGG